MELFFWYEFFLIVLLFSSSSSTLFYLVIAFMKWPIFVSTFFLLCKGRVSLIYAFLNYFVLRRVLSSGCLDLGFISSIGDELTGLSRLVDFEPP